MYECRCNERLKTKSEKSTLFTYTGLIGELEHLKIETRLIDEIIQLSVYYESRKRELKIRLMNEGRCDERLKVELRNLHVSRNLTLFL
jgi:hypothetical protein